MCIYLHMRLFIIYMYMCIYLHILFMYLYIFIHIFLTLSFAETCSLQLTTNICLLINPLFVCVRLCVFVCDQVVCGRRPCLPQSSSSQSQPSCPAGHECLKHNFFTCFSPPCHQWGVCSTSGASLPQVTTKCQPNSGHLDNSCVRMTLVFNRDKVPAVSLVLLGDDVRGFVVLDMNLMSDVLHTAGNDSGERLLRADVSTWNPRLGTGPRSSAALRPLSFQSGFC